MSVSSIDWHSLTRLTGDALKQEVFSALQKASIEIQTGELDDPALLSLVPRLAELLQNRKELTPFGEVFSALARSVGLWNYIDKSVADPRDRLLSFRA